MVALRPELLLPPPPHPFFSTPHQKESLNRHKLEAEVQTVARRAAQWGSAITWPAESSSESQVRGRALECGASGWNPSPALTRLVTLNEILNHSTSSSIKWR